MKQVSLPMFGLLPFLIMGSPSAQTSYPERPVRIVVPLQPGFPLETLVRLLGDDFATTWGKPVVVHHVIGAEGTIAADRVGRRPRRTATRWAY
jgi:tripartite-type tricarboxylate transporter receptor subunit TctC